MRLMRVTGHRGRSTPRACAEQWDCQAPLSAIPRRSPPPCRLHRPCNARAPAASGLPVLRPQRDYLREADSRFVRPLHAVQQNAEVVVRVRVFWIYANGGSIRRLGFDHLAFGPQDDTEIVVCVGM